MEDESFLLEVEDVRALIVKLWRLNSMWKLRSLHGNTFANPQTCSR